MILKHSNACYSHFWLLIILSRYVDYLGHTLFRIVLFHVVATSFELANTELLLQGEIQVGLVQALDSLFMNQKIAHIP